MTLLLTVFFGWEFFFIYNPTYNELGRYFDEENVVVYHEQAIPFYGLLFVSCLVALNDNVPVDAKECTATR